MPNFFERHRDTLITVATVLVAFLGFVAIIDQRFNAQENLINQRFDAQDRRIDNLEADMNQRFDAMYRYMNQRFDAQDRYMSQRFDDQDRYMDQRFDAVDQRLDQLTSEAAELRKLTVGIIERVSRNEGEIDVIREQLQTADKPASLD